MNERFEAEMYESEQIAKAKVVLRNECKQFTSLRDVITNESAMCLLPTGLIHDCLNEMCSPHYDEVIVKLLLRKVNKTVKEMCRYDY